MSSAQVGSRFSVISTPDEYDFSLRQLRYFVSVAELGTMAAAAERHHISQSAVSLAIGQLERTLAVQLFIRRKARGVSLTETARLVLPQARNLLDHAGDLQTTARSLGQTIAGSLELGCYPTLTPFVMPEILRRLPDRYPDIAVNLREGSVEDLVGALIDGSCELAIMYDLGIPDDVATERLYTMRPYVLLSADHRLASDEPINLQTLRGEPMVMLDMPPSSAMFRQVLAEGGVDPQIRYVSTSFESVRSLVASGCGYSLLLQRPSPEFTYAGPPLTYREVADAVLTVDVVVARARDARLTQRATAFARFCLTSLGAAP